MDNFDLDRAIAAWRRGLKRNRTLLSDDLEELEEHLRDHIEELVGDGLSPKDAHAQAMRRLGSQGILENEFQKVRRGRSKRRKSLREDSVWTTALMANYLRLGARTMRRHAFFTSLNIVGLAIGLASCLLILLYMNSELKYDQFHLNGDRTYRMNWDFAWDGREGTAGGTPPPLAKSVLQEIPGIETVTRVYSIADVVVRRDNRFFTEGNVLAVDTTFLDVFSFPLTSGDPETALAAPGSVVLTRSTAQKYFGNQDPLGRPLILGEDGTVFGRPYTSAFTVTGVAEDPPTESHIQFDMLTSMASHPIVEQFDWSWVWMQVVTYAVVSEKADTALMGAQITDMVARLAPPAFTRVGFSFDELIEAGGHWDFPFQPIEDIYLGSADIGNRIGPTGSRSNLQIFGIIALFVLLIACINAMNLSTARASRRATEVGIRKALGSARSALVAQFLVESVLFSMFAMAIAIVLTVVLLGPFNQVAGKSLSISTLATPAALGVIAGLTLLVTLISGGYSSLVLSAFRPIDVLKGHVVSGKRGLRFRNGLVVTQFAISIALITCTLLVRSQMSFFRDMDLGYEVDGILVVSNHDHRLGGQPAAFADALREQGAIVNASVSTSIPPAFAFEDYYKVEGKGDEQVEMASYLVDDDFIQTLGMEVVEGEAFQPGSSINSRAILINQVAASQFGLDDPIGKRITYPGTGDFTVIGVVRDFNFRSLQEPVRPFGLMHESSNAYDIPHSSVSVRIRKDQVSEAVAAIQSTWNRFAPDQPFEYVFLDDTLEALYANERRLETLFLIFATLAIIVACLGLLGLAAFVAEKRTKEIGIRKSLGASEGSLVVLLVRDFTKWVLLANLLAWPLAWIWVRGWLDDFAFQTEIGFAPFIWAGGAALVIAVATVGYQAAKAARADPVQALRWD